MSKKVRVAFCGTRGLPANYGGFETAIDEITNILVNKDIECHVFCRETTNQSNPSEFEGRKLTYIKGSSSKKLDTFISSINTGIYLIKNRKKFDYVLWFNNANLPGIILTILAGIPFAVNTDGLEWKRAKWSWPFKLYYFLSSMIISMVCRNLISDSISIQNYYRRVFLRKTQFIPYGSPKETNLPDKWKNEVLEKYNLEENKYFLQITRFEPDNLPLEILQSFQKSELYKKGYKFILIGYKDPTIYSEKLKKLDGKNGIHVLPANYNTDELSVLRKSAYCYLHGNSVGGTNPALLEAMSFCKRIIAIEGPFSKEVLNGNGLLFQRETLPELFIHSLKMNDQSISMRKRIAEYYRWDAVAESYMKLMNKQNARYVDELNNIQPNHAERATANMLTS